MRSLSIGGMENDSLNPLPTSPSSEPAPQVSSRPLAAESSGAATTSSVASALTTEQKIWLLVCHLSIFLGIALLAPLVVYLIKKDEDANLREHAKEALNFHITIAIVLGVAFLLSFILIGLPILFLTPIFAFICSIFAAIKAVDGKVFRYPLTLRLVK